jgi:hypothetical protein
MWGAVTVWGAVTADTETHTETHRDTETLTLRQRQRADRERAREREPERERQRERAAAELAQYSVLGSLRPVTRFSFFFLERRVVDVGSGNGIATAELARRYGLNVIGVDHDEQVRKPLCLCLSHCLSLAVSLSVDHDEQVRKPSLYCLLERLCLVCG